MSRIRKRGGVSGADEVTLAPVVRWPGGKRLLAKRIIAHMPSDYERYIEPFLGGGAVFLALQPRRALLSDSNIELINLYKTIRDSPKRLHQAIRRLRNTESEYYRVRESAPRGELGRAARLLYLAAFSFNGIYRVNRRGLFNVPYGYRSEKKLPDEERLWRFASALENASLSATDFAFALRSARRRDLIYLDPPYATAPRKNGFLRYNERVFSWGDQLRLRRAVERLSQRGCYVVMTIGDHVRIRELYEGYVIHEIDRHSCIASRPLHRRPIKELLVTNAACSMWS